MIQAYKDAFRRPDSDLIHLNNAGISPWPLQTELAVTAHSRKLAQGGAHAIGSVVEKSEETRPLLAKLLGAAPEQIAFFQTCAIAISQVAFGLKLEAGAEIVTFDQEYPSNFYPWRIAAERANGQLKIAKSLSTLATPLDAIKAQVTDRTKVIAVSWVQYRNGAITDLQELAAFAKSKGILTCVDIIQGAGLLPFDFVESGIDFACGGSHKWLTSPASLGYLVIKPELIEMLTPLSVGAMSFGGFDKLSDIHGQLVKGIARFEPGGRSLLEMVAMGETLKLINDTGLLNITSEIESLSRRLLSGLAERGFEIHSPHGLSFRGSIVNFVPTSKTPSIDQLEQRLTSSKISFAKRPPGIRLSPHAFVTTDQIDRTLEVLS